MDFKNLKIMINFLKQIFTWWHKQTLELFYKLYLQANLLGIDKFGNKYYSNSREMKMGYLFKQDRSLKNNSRMVSLDAFY